MAALRCRLGFHRWVQIKQPRGYEDAWRIECGDCNKQTGEGSSAGVWASLVALAVAAVLFVVWPTLLVAFLVIGAVAGLGISVLPQALTRVGTWLSVGRR